jgi:concanavalin A-like lectin/glucanase superfamily protein
MSRTNFSTSNYLAYSGAVVTGLPLTMACWVLDPSKTLSTTNHLMSVKDDASGTNRNGFMLTYNGAGNIIARTGGASAFSDATAAGTMPDNIWTHAAGVWASTTSRAAFRNGANKGTNATSQTVASVNTASIAVSLGSSGPISNTPPDALIAEAGIWNAALTDDEIGMLALGVVPYMVRPSALVAYWPLMGILNPEIDVVGRQEMVIQGSLSAGAHPAIRYYPGNTRRTSYHSIMPVNVSLAGVMGTGAVGTLAKTVSRSLTGNAGISGTSAFGISALKTLTGVAGAGAAGTITPKALISLLGVAGTAAMGALVADTAQRIHLAGVQGTSAIGALQAAVHLLLTGNGAAGDVGALAEPITLALIGAAAEMGIGDVTIADNWIRAGHAGGVWAEAPETVDLWTPTAPGSTGWTRP